MTTTVHLTVTGKVQGVGFRANTARTAHELNLRGWVRNLADGSVEIVASGPVALIDEFLDWCAEGPRAARVDGIEATPVTLEEVEDLPAEFQIR